ncbi:MAG: hypothetical protein WDO18_09865 [Acidobacteriota bacterium]
MGQNAGAMKAGIAAVLAMVIGGAFYMTTYSNNAAAKVAASKGPVYELGRPMNSTGWIEDWAPNDNFRRVTLLRGSQESSDYRMQFNAQIQSKAVGWMFRGLNPRNFYVAKVEKARQHQTPVRTSCAMPSSMAAMKAAWRSLWTSRSTSARSIRSSSKRLERISRSGFRTSWWINGRITAWVLAAWGLYSEKRRSRDHPR